MWIWNVTVHYFVILIILQRSLSIFLEKHEFFFFCGHSHIPEVIVDFLRNKRWRSRKHVPPVITDWLVMVLPVHVGVAEKYRIVLTQQIFVYHFLSLANHSWDCAVDACEELDWNVMICRLIVLALHLKSLSLCLHFVVVDAVGAVEAHFGEVVLNGWIAEGIFVANF